MNRSGIHAGLRAPRPRRGRFVWTVVLVAMAMSASQVQTARAQCESWAPLGMGMDSVVWASTLLPNGDVIAGGNFFGNGEFFIARWDGMNWFALGTGLDGQIRALTTLPNGDLIAGGFFVGGVPGNSIARWNGMNWSALGTGTNGFIEALTTLPNGDLIAGGFFTMAGGAAANNIARWDGTNWSALGAGTSGVVTSLSTLPNGDLVAGGQFTMAGGTAVSNIARWDGASWFALGTGMNNPVNALSTLPNGDLVAGGQFTMAGGTAVSNIARWNGTSWSVLGTGVNSIVYALTTLDNGDLIAGGFFTMAGGVATNRIARWDGTTWSAVGTGMNSSVLALTPLPNGDLVAGGDFTSAGGVPANYIARLPAPVIDLAITKTDGQASAVPGQTVTYTITVTNNALCEATDATVVDMFPAALTGVNYTSVVTDGATGNTAMGNGDINDIVTMPAGSTITYTATGTVMPGATGTLDNTASVTAPAGVVDPDLTNNTDTDSDMLTPTADLSISKVESSDPVNAGSMLTYMITVSNAGPSDAQNVIVTDTLPAEVAFVSTTGCAEDPAGVPSCTLGTIAAGANAQYTVGVTVDSPLPSGVDVVTNSASVTSDTTDPDGANNATSEDTIVVAAPDLRITKDDGGITSRAGEVIAYTLNYANAGSQDATGVVITDTVPANTTFNAGASSPGWSCQDGDPAGTVCTFAVGTVAGGPGASATFAVEVVNNPADLLGVLEITNTASIADNGANGPDENAADNSDNDTTSLVRLLVSNGNTDNILRYDGATGAFIDAFVPTGGGGLDLPFGLVFGPDGNLYVCSAITHSILRYDGATGAFIDAFVPTGGGGLNSPYGLIFGPDGNLYVSSFFTSSVLRYNGATGAFIDAFVPANSGGLSFPSGLVFGPDGNLYVSGLGTNNILRYNGATGAFIDAFVLAGGGGLNQPTGLVFGPDGHLYVSSFLTDSVLRYNGATGTFINAFVPAAPVGAPGRLSFPIGLIFGPDGHLYVISDDTNSILRYNGATGAFIDSFVGGLNRPRFLIFDNDSDFDGVPDANDNCPFVANTDQTDSDGDVVGDICDDSDGDGLVDAFDNCPNDPAKTDPGICGCGTPDIDADNDGTLDCNDACPNDAAKIAAGVCGCGNAETDANNNGVADCIDPTIGPCPNDITVQATSDAGIAVDFMLPAGNSPLGNVVVTSNPPAGSTLPVGTTTVTITATDANNVTATCTFDVIVTPQAAPAPQPEPQPAPQNCDNEPLRSLLSIIFRAPLCGMGACPALMLTIIGLMGIKRTVRRRRR